VCERALPMLWLGIVERYMSSVSRIRLAQSPHQPPILI
jgi:hypothetical protein